MARDHPRSSWKDLNRCSARAATVMIGLLLSAAARRAQRRCGSRTFLLQLGAEDPVAS